MADIKRRKPRGGEVFFVRSFVDRERLGLAAASKEGEGEDGDDAGPV